MSHYSGEMFALLTALLWTISSVCWTVAGEKIGSLVVNVIRLCIALPLLMIFGLVLDGEAIPFSASQHSWIWLGLSGFFGFFLSDLIMFRAMLIIGPRLSMLILSLAPPFTALFGWLVLNEHLSLLNWAGIALVVSGVMWAITAPPEPATGQRHRYVFSAGGGILAFAGTIAMAVAMVLAKKGMSDNISAVAATQIRVIPAIACFLILVLVLRRYPSVFQALRERRTMQVLFIGSVAGPFLGVIMMMIAIQRVEVGIAQTFISLSPILIIPFMRVIFKEPVRLRSLAGAALACAGIALLFIKN